VIIVVYYDVLSQYFLGDSKETYERKPTIFRSECQEFSCQHRTVKLQFDLV